jgi:hypothetical protein
MKQIVSNYSYSPATNVVTLTGVNIDADQLLLIVAPEVGRTMYNFASVTGSVVAGANTRVTLNASTAGLTASSPLVIFYDDQTAAQSVTGTVALDPASLTALENVTVTIGSSVTVSGTVTANLVGKSLGQNDLIQTNGSGSVRVSLTTDSQTQVCDDDGNSYTAVNPFPVSGTVTANLPNTSQDPLAVGIWNDSNQMMGADVPILVGSAVTISGVRESVFLNVTSQGSPIISGTVTASVIDPNSALQTIISDGVNDAIAFDSDINGAPSGKLIQIGFYDPDNTGNMLLVNNTNQKLPVDASGTVNTLKNIDFIKLSSTSGNIAGLDYNFPLGYAKRTADKRWDIGELYVYLNENDNQWQLISTNNDNNGLVAYYDLSSARNRTNIPPQTGWTFTTDWSGAGFAISYEQPSTQLISGSVTVGNSITANLGNYSSAVTNNYKISGSISSVTGMPVVFPEMGTYGSIQGYNGTNGYLNVGLKNLGSISLEARSDMPISGTVTIGNTSITVGAMPSGALTTRFGTPTTASTAFLTTAVTNTFRKYLLIQNVTTASNVITVGIGFTPTTTQGIQLAAGAGITFESSYIPTGAVWVLSSVTASNYTILEA